MSEWREIEDPDDISISDEGKIMVRIDSNAWGNVYVEFPLEFILNKLPVRKG